MYKLKNVNGRVNFLLRTGKDFVKNSMSITAAQHIIESGEMIESSKKNYPICVNDKWFFEGVETEEKETTPVTNKRRGRKE